MQYTHSYTNQPKQSNDIHHETLHGSSQTVSAYLFVSEGEVAFPEGGGHVLDVAPHRREVVRVALKYSAIFDAY
jgi:hypothetical protein